MKIRLSFFLLIFFFALPVFLFSQANDFLDAYFEEPSAGFGKTAYLVLLAGGLIQETTTLNDAMAFLAKKKWGVEMQNADTPITLSNLAMLLMKTMNMNGGIMYSAFPSPRYALRELVFLRVITGNDTPGRAVSGREVYSLLRKVIELKEESK